MDPFKCQESAPSIGNFRSCTALFLTGPFLGFNENLGNGGKALSVRARNTNIETSNTKHEAPATRVPRSQESNPPLGPPYGPRHRPPVHVGSWGAYARGIPVQLLLRLLRG